MPFLKKHRWYFLIGGHSAVFTIAALIGGNTDAMYFSIALKPQMIFYYFFVCVAGFYLLDQFLFQKKYLAYAAWLAMLVIAATVAGALLSPIRLFDTKGSNYLLHSISIITLLCISTFLRLLKERILNKAEYNEYKARRAEAELKLLRQQLNPHFLFNTLNSVYAQCLEDREDAGDMVLQLSDMLRYQLETDKKNAIPLEDELRFIDNYIFFEQRRLPPGYSVHYQKDIDDAGITLAPLLLITLIENCFKHGIRVQGNHVITIQVTVKNNCISLHTSNPVSVKTAASSSTQIGLQNLRKRLQLLYPQRFTLSTIIEAELYHAQLQIQL